MGKWAQGEFDRVLVTKIKQLFDICNDDQIFDTPVDKTFQAFIKNLNPQDRAVQACFGSLIQQNSYFALRKAELERLRAENREVDRLRVRRQETERTLSFSPEIRGAFGERDGLVERRAVRPLRRHTTVPFPDSISTSPDPISFAIANEPSTSAFLSPSRARRRSASPSHSPSRYVRDRPTDTDLFVSSGGSTSPRSPSQRWLEEYRTSAPTTRPADDPYGGIPLPDLWSAPDGYTEYAGASYARRRRLRENDSGEDERPSNRPRYQHEGRPPHSRQEPPSTAGSRRMTRVPNAATQSDPASAQRDRDTRRDGIVFDGYSMALPPLHTSGGHYDHSPALAYPAIFSSNDDAELPYRHYARPDGNMEEATFFDYLMNQSRDIGSPPPLPAPGVSARDDDIV